MLLLHEYFELFIGCIGTFLLCYRLENLSAACQETEHIRILVHLGQRVHVEIL